MKNKSKLNTILLIIIIILLVVVLGYLFMKDSKEKEDNLIENTSQENEVVGSSSLPILKINNECPESIKYISIFDLAYNKNGQIEAQAYYKTLPTEYNNFNFDETISCKLPFSKMSVFGRYGENGAKKYEYTEFSKLNTFENYISDRTKKFDYVTNVFSITKTNNIIVFDELYQE